MQPLSPSRLGRDENRLNKQHLHDFGLFQMFQFPILERNVSFEKWPSVFSFLTHQQYEKLLTMNFLWHPKKSPWIAGNIPFTKFTRHNQIHKPYFMFGQATLRNCPSISNLVTSGIKHRRLLVVFFNKTPKIIGPADNRVAFVHCREASVHQSFRVFGDNFWEFTWDWRYEQVSSVLWGTQILKS